MQVEYYLFTHNAEKIGLFRECHNLGGALAAYPPLGRAMLSGAYRFCDDFEASEGQCKAFAHPLYLPVEQR